MLGAARATVSPPKAPARSADSIGSVGGSARDGGCSGLISNGGSVGAALGGQGGHFFLPHATSWARAGSAIIAKHSRGEIPRAKREIRKRSDCFGFGISSFESWKRIFFF